MRKFIVIACLIIAFTSTPVVKSAEHSADLVIYGNTSAGVAAAVQAKRMGLSVVLVGPDKHLGGLSAGGLGWTDSGNKAVIGGVSREFYQRVKKYYDEKKTWKWQDSGDYGKYREGDDAQWTFEPHIAERVFEDLVRETKIPVHRDQWLNRADGEGVAMKEGRIVSITMLSGDTYRGKMFIDATYEGDLMAAAGVSYTVGREANSKYGETLNGVQVDHAYKHQFTHKISPYKTPGDPSSGLLPRVSAEPPGKQGEADHRVQAYNFRMCLTRVPENRVPFPKPEGYDAGQYELLLRTLLAGSRHIKGKFDMLPNLKTDTNNHGSFSTDNIGMNYDYPEASYERRREIIAEHRTYQQGYCYFLANDPRVPKDVRDWYSAWGLAKDEFTDNGHWPHQIYVREARRMVSDYVVTELDCRRTRICEDSVGLGSYNMDSHNVQRHVTKDGWVRNEGDIQVSPRGAYLISYRSIVPKRGEAKNLLAPVCISSSHIAFGSIRMEPVFMILGQSAATAAAQAIEGGIAVQDVKYDKLRERLLADKQVLDLPQGTSGGDGIDPKKLPGIVIDDSQAKLNGNWTSSSSVAGYIGSGYLHDNNEGKGSRTATFTATVPKAGKYEIRLAYTPQENRASNVPVSIQHGSLFEAQQVNQQRKPPLAASTVSLGSFQLDADKPVSVAVSNQGTDGYVIIDAVQILPSK